MIISHNLAAMNSQIQFNIVGNSKKKSTEKLSSGYKINRAADDAAGLTISEKMRSMIRGLNQGSKNTQDGISWIQVADGAMAEGHDMVHRIKELAVYAANGTLTDADRKAIDEEVQSILDEIHRIDMSTQFNTKDVFLHGDVMFEVKGEPGELEVYDAIADENGVTFGGFIFHGERISFDQINPNMVRMENGQQVFCGKDGLKTGEYTYTNDNKEFFTIVVNDGDPVPQAKRKITVDAKLDSGIIIDGHVIPWSKTIDEDGMPVDPNNPKRGTFSVPYGNSVLDITVGTNCSLRNGDEFIDAIKNHESVEANGGVSYQWITELDGVYAGNAMISDPASFTDGIINPSDDKKRNIDNVMAYDSHTDIYNSNLSDGRMEYKLVASIVKTEENERVHNDLANGTATATRKGQDVNNQDIRLYLIGTDGKEIEGSSVLLSELKPNSVSTDDWVKGMGLSDGDYCDDHGYTYSSQDNFVDKIFTYSDPSAKTDIKMQFKLSEVVSADSIAYNVELVDPRKNIQDYSKGLNGTTYYQDFDSKFMDVMSVSDPENKIKLLNNGCTEYDATYDLNIALGRNFDDANDTLAVVNGVDSVQEGKITYDGKSISFAVKGDIQPDKTSTNYAATRGDNNVDFLEFNVDTSKQENDFVRNILNNANTITQSKINQILSGAATDEIAILPSVSQKITIADDNVITGVGLKASSREYVYGYEYDDLMKTFNDNSANSNASGEKITTRMSTDSITYDAGAAGMETAVVDRYLKLKTDYKFSNEPSTHLAESYINAQDLTNNIGSIVNRINDKLDDTVFVYDKLKKEYVKKGDYESNLKTEIDRAKTNALGDLTGNEYLVYASDAGTKIEATSVFRVGKASIHTNDINKTIKDALTKDAYYLTDKNGEKMLDGNDDPILLTGEGLKTEVLTRLGNIISDTTSFVLSKLNDIPDSSYKTDTDGHLDLSAIFPDEIADWVNEATDIDVANVKWQNKSAAKNDVLDLFLQSSAFSDELKNIIKDNASFETINGSFLLDADTLDKVLNKDTIATNECNKAQMLEKDEEPVISKENLEKIFKPVLNNAVFGLTGNAGTIAGIIKDNLDVANGWLNISEGKITLSDKALTTVVNNLTDGKLRTIEAYYGGVDEAHLIDKQVSRNGKNGYYSYVVDNFNKTITPDAVAYVKDAMGDIVRASTFTLETDGYATTKMSTKSNPGRISYARYNSDIEMEFNGGFRIQHSGINDDYTTINQFCFNTAVMKITNVNLKTQESARKALDKVDYALDYISGKRSELGATQNRLEHTFRNNENKAENLTAAESRIRDTDMAKEVFNNTRLGILEQAVMSMLAQANQSNQGILMLLQ